MCFRYTSYVLPALLQGQPRRTVQPRPNPYSPPISCTTTRKIAQETQRGKQVARFASREQTARDATAFSRRRTTEPVIPTGPPQADDQARHSDESAAGGRSCHASQPTCHPWPDPSIATLARRSFGMTPGQTPNTYEVCGSSRLVLSGALRDPATRRGGVSAAGRIPSRPARSKLRRNDHRLVR